MKPRISPREFLRTRRPEKFSDSIEQQSPVLDRSQLEYHLFTLTSRNQETVFEVFAKELAERTICPNLRPQTGPTGGGDSKVDSETYPVSDLLSLTWYEGIGSEARSERWAFAFSAKKDWRPKAYSDIAKLASTDRGYSKGFFITNQFVPDRTRGEVEDSLSKKYAPLDVRILDLNWILDRIFTENLESLAISELGFEVSTRTEVEKGPIDVQRERDLAEIEARIKAAPTQNRLGLGFANDCIDAAILSRGLGRPRTAVEGRFQRAQRVSEDYGTLHQRLVSVYQWAWTLFWWYEDYPSFAELYGVVESYAKGTENIHDLQLLSNLWYLLGVLARSNAIEPSEFEERTSVLASELERMAQEESRPSAALQAKSLRLLLKMLPSMHEADDVLRDLRRVVLDSEGLIGFPLDPLINILIELGNYLTDRQGYQELFNTVLEISERRKGEVAAARLRLRRGAQQLDADRPYDAIVTLGQALRPLFKHETEHDLVWALYLCSMAYEQVGLLWAARGTLLNGAAIAMSDFWKYSNVTQLQAMCTRQMKWVELKLGRLPHVLAWHEVDYHIRGELIDAGSHPTPDDHGTETNFDAILGILILKSDLWSLSRLTFLPDVLGELGLPYSNVALRFALGDQEQLWQEIKEGIESDEFDDMYSFFWGWRQQPAADDVPDGPHLYNETRVVLESNILGCRIQLESDNASPCLEIAESALAALESLMATGFRDRIFPREPRLTGSVRKSDFPKEIFGFDLGERDGIPHLEIRCSDFTTHDMSVEAQEEAQDKIGEMVGDVLSRAFVLKNPEETLTKLLRDEGALERALNFTRGFVVQGNVLGSSPKTKISDWKKADARLYPLSRSQVWDTSSRRDASSDLKGTRPPDFEVIQGEPPVDTPDAGTIRHTDMEAISLIRGSLWDRAEWSAAAYIVAIDDSMPPVLALVFKDRETARQIFRAWRRELGPHDNDDKLRVSIIRGIDKENPFTYRVIIGANVRAASPGSDTRYILSSYRIHTMVPTSDENLVRFLGSFRKLGHYVLAYALTGDDTRSIRPIFDDAIGKRELNVREAWEVGRHDLDSGGILVDDDPIVPATQQDPPVRELIEWKRSLDGT